MDRSARKAALDAYRDRKPRAGIYALGSNGQIWVGATADLDKIGNQIVFSLKLGGRPNTALQTAHNAEPVKFEILEALEDDLERLSHDLRLRQRQHHWINTLSAHRL